MPATAQWLRDASPTLSVGILSADLTALGSELALLERAGAHVAHVDVMDGCFCPMMTVGPPIVRALKTPLLKDVHLMIRDPLDKVAEYVTAGADIVTVHAEAGPHIHRTLQQMRSMKNSIDPERGLVRGVALNPGTPLEALEPLWDELDLVLILAVNPGWKGQEFIASTWRRLEAVKQRIKSLGSGTLVALDGGITRDNIREAAASGADIIVSGSAVFDGKNAVHNAEFMLGALRSVAKAKWQ
jgi:ribulose-phosphate 3-epimerase